MSLKEISNILFKRGFIKMWTEMKTWCASCHYYIYGWLTIRGRPLISDFIIWELEFIRLVSSCSFWFWVKIALFKVSRSLLSLVANFLVSDWSKPESNALSSFKSFSFLLVWFLSLPPDDPSASELEEWDTNVGIDVAWALSCGNFEGIACSY